MTIIEGILAYMAGEAEAMPAPTTEAERLLAKAAQKIKAGLVPGAKAADAGKVLTVDAEGDFGWDDLPADPAET